MHIPGLHEEQLTLIKYFLEDSQREVSFENMTCMGKAWRYNLYDIRPERDRSFLSQVVGSKNIKGTCDDYNYRPIWSYLKKIGYSGGILQNKSTLNETFIEKAVSCKRSDFYKDVVTWIMKEGGKGTSKFHAQEKVEYESGRIYFDRSCRKGGCYNSILSNTKSIIQKYFRSRSNYFFLIENYNLERALKTRDAKKLEASLDELDRIVSYLKKVQEANSDLLLVVTSSDPKPLEMPAKGLAWKNLFEKNKLDYKRSSLMSPVWASGVRAENFCGIYQEAEVFKRILQNFTKQRMEVLGVPLL